MPILDDLILKIDIFWYNIIYMLAAAQWSMMRGVLMMGYTIELLTQWMTNQAFSPLIQQTNDSLRVATSLSFVVALMVLGVTYLLAAIIRLDIVSPRNAILWYFAGVLFFSIGPSLYQGMNNFRSGVSTAFYLSVLNTLKGQEGAALSSLSSVQTTDLGILAPCDNFGPYLGHPGGYGLPTTLSGLDIALSYLRADGIDVMGYPYPISDSCQPHAPPQSFPIPWEWQRPGSYFDLTKGPDLFPGMSEDQRQQSINTATASLWRLFSAWPLVWFGVIEQLTALLLSIAYGLTFISFGCAILFAFFKRTEPIAWSMVDQWLMLIVQTVAIALIQALVVSFFLAGAATHNPLVVDGVGLICLMFMAILLWSGVKTVWRIFNGLFDAISKATGGVFATPGEAAKSAIGAGAALATGGVSLAGSALSSGMSLAGNALGGASALANGGSWAQAGITFGGSQTLTGAARTLTRLPGLRHSELESVADQFVEGAATRQVARNVPLVGRITGPVVGASLLSDRNPDNAYEDDEGRLRQPMLVPAVGQALSGFTRGPGWQRKGQAEVKPDNDDDDLIAGRFIPLAPTRMGRFIPIAPLASDVSNDVRVETLNDDITELDADETANRQVSDYAVHEEDEMVEQQITQAISSQSSETRIGETSLENAGSRLERAADALTQAAQAQPMQQVEGRLNVSGSTSVASVMGDTVGLIQTQNGSASLQGVDNFSLAATMAQSMGVTPVDNGKPPIESDLARFGVFGNQALTMGLNGEQAERVVREVNESPEGKIQPETRTELVEQVHSERNLAWDDANREVDRVEHAARMLPNDISAYGVMSLPAASTPLPVINVAPQVTVQPLVQVTVETNQNDGYADGLREQASMTGSQAILNDSISSRQGAGE